MENDEKKPEIKASEESPKPKIVRNREVDRAAKELADDHILPLPPGKNLTFDQMQEYLGLLTPAMWSHVSIYLYRIKPKIRRQLKDPNSPNYIDNIGEPFGMEYLISRHGGGKYQIQATDTEAKKDNHTNFLFKCNFDINEVQYPPILNYEELELDAKENKSYVAWLQNKGILDAKGNVLPPQGQQNPPSTATNLSAKDILDILGFAQRMSSDQQAAFRAQFAPGADSLSKSVGEILLEKMRQDDPGNNWDRMMTFMEKLHKPDNSMPAFLQMMNAQIVNANEQRKIDLEHTKLLLDTQRREASPRNQLGEFREIIAFARELIGTGGNGRRSGWDTGLEIARDVVLPAVQSLGATITNIMSLRNGAAPVAAQPAAKPAAPVAFDPYRNPQAARTWAAATAQQPQPQPAPGQAPPQPPPPPPPGQPQPQPQAAAAGADAEAQLSRDLAQFGGLIVNHMNNNTPGFDFADYVAGLFGTGMHAQICGFGEAALVGTMLRIPEIAMFGESRIRQFVNEFIHYEEYIQAQASEEEEPAEEETGEDAEGPTVDMPKFYKPHGRATHATHSEA